MVCIDDILVLLHGENLGFIVKCNLAALELTFTNTCLSLHQTFHLEQPLEVSSGREVEHAGSVLEMVVTLDVSFVDSMIQVGLPMLTHLRCRTR